METLLKELKKRCNNNSIRLTQGIEFEYDKSNKTVHMALKTGISSNMQENVAAFEGWAIAIKANLEDLVKKVILSWKEENEPDNKNTAAWRHFNRFIYRVDTFQNQYSDWFIVENKNSRWEDRIIKQGWENLVLNEMGERNPVDSAHQYEFKNEHGLETYFANSGQENLRAVVKKQFNIELGDIKNQYPVGVFSNEVSKQSAVFTGGKSAIDLYSTSKDNSFNIFELKIENNVEIGIISELFFYSSLIRDAVAGNFKSKGGEFADINHINAFFLVQRLHPLITEKVMDMLNLPDNKITYRKIIYNVNDVQFME